MLITLFIWIYCWFVLTALGLTFHYISAKTLKKQIAYNTISPIQTLFNGFCVCMGICSILYFYSKIGLAVHLGVFVIAGFTCFLLKQSWKMLIYTIKTKITELHILQKIVIVIALFTLLVASVSQPTNIDSGNYHTQVIQWINEYKIIPGLGNLLGNLAYNQSSFFVESFFSFSFIGLSPFRGLNGFMAFMVITNIITTLNFKKPKADLNHIIGVTTIVFFLLHYKDWISSPTPDIISALMTYYVFWLSLQRISDKTPKQSDYSLITIFFISVSALTVKLSVVTLPLVALVLIFCTPNFFRTTKWWIYIVIGLLVMTPWFIRSVILSGYLVFPMASIDLFNYDWKIPKVMVEGIKNSIHGFSTDRFTPWVELMKLSRWERTVIWFEKTSWFRISLLIIVLLSQLIYLVKIAFWKTQSKYQKDLFFLNTAIFAGIVFWFLNAPDFRFGSAFIYIYVAIALLTFLPKKIKLNRVFLVSLSCVAVLFLVRKLKINDIKEYPITVASYNSPEVNILTANGFNYAVPIEGNQCWNYSVPCIPFGDLSKVALRGKNIEDGFKWEYSKEE